MILKFWPRRPRKWPLNLSSLGGIEFSSFWVSRSFDLGDLGVLEKSWGNIFNNYIFEISRFHWSKCTIECAIYSILILKSAQARCAYLISIRKFNLQPQFSSSKVNIFESNNSQQFFLYFVTNQDFQNKK